MTEGVDKEPEQLEMPWGSETEAKDVSVADMEKLCKDIEIQRAKYEKVSAQAKDEYKLLSKMEAKLIFVLNQLGKSNYSSGVGRFTIMHRTSVKVPKGDAWDQFCQYLKDTGQDRALLTVNSQTLNGWYRNQMNQAKEEGRELEFAVPGIEPPQVSQILSFSKSK